MVASLWCTRCTRGGPGRSAGDDAAAPPPRRRASALVAGAGGRSRGRAPPSSSPRSRPAATLVWLLAALPDVVDGEVRTEHVEWIPELGVDLDLRLDGFAALMLLLVAGIGVLVVAYAWRYFHRPDAGRRAPRSGCSCCSPGRWSGSSWPTTCSCSTGSGS